MSIVATDITVQFGGLRAVDDASVRVDKGRVTALIGPNGAGKSTFLNVLSGFVKATEGTIEVDGKDLTKAEAHHRSKNGIARSFQTPRFVPHLSVLENVLMGFYPTAGASIASDVLWGAPKEKRLEHAAMGLLEEFGLDEVAHERAADVPLWRLRIMEIARCMAAEPSYVLLDEPAAGFDEEERDLLADQIMQLRDRNVGILLVEHNFGFIKRVSSHVTVLAQGKHLAEGDPEQIERDPRVVEVYLGKEEI